MPGTVEELSEIDLSEVRDMVGARSFDRGRSYARDGRVLATEWAPADFTLTGVVTGTAVYATTAYFADIGEGIEFEHGECTCPVGFNCKHVAAIVIAAASESARPESPPPGSSTRRPANDPPPWEQSLRGLIEAPPAPAGERPLAIELSLRPMHDRYGLMARLMRPGARGGWVNGSLSWGGLDSWHVREGEYRSDHLALARELNAVHRAREQRVGFHHYAHGESGDRTLDLSECDSPQLWSLLDEAARIGLPLIHALPNLGELTPYERGELHVDVSRDGKRGARVAAALRLGENEAAGLTPLLFLGASGHGVVCVGAGSGRWSSAAARSSSPPTCRRSRSRRSRSTSMPATASSTTRGCSASGRRSSA